MPKLRAAQWVKALVALSEDVSSIPKTHTGAHSHITPLLENSIPSSDFYWHKAHMWYRDIHAGENAHIK